MFIILRSKSIKSLNWCNLRKSMKQVTGINHENYTNYLFSINFSIRIICYNKIMSYVNKLFLIPNSVPKPLPLC